MLEQLKFLLIIYFLAAGHSFMIKAFVFSFQPLQMLSFWLNWIAILVLSKKELLEVMEIEDRFEREHMIREIAMNYPLFKVLGGCGTCFCLWSGCFIALVTLLITQQFSVLSFVALIAYPMVASGVYRTIREQ